MKTILAFLTYFLLIITTQPIDAKDSNWHTGILYFKNNEVVKGEIRLVGQSSMVQCKTEGKVLTYSPYQVKVFQYYDEENGKSKIFTSVLDLKRGRPGQKKFLEVILTGKITILRRERYAVQQVSPAFDAHAGKEAFIRSSTYLEVTKYDYYIYSDGSFFRMKNFEKSVYTLCEDARKKIDDFISAHQLNIKNNIYDQLKVVEYYNRLHKNVSLPLHEDLAHYE